MFILVEYGKAWVWCGCRFQVPPQKPLSSTPKTPQCKLVSSTQKKTEGVCGIEGFLVWNWGMYWTEGISVLNCEIFGGELRDFWCWKGVVLLLNWGSLCGAVGYSNKLYSNSVLIFDSRLVGTVFLHMKPQFWFRGEGENQNWVFNAIWKWTKYICYIIYISKSNNLFCAILNDSVSIINYKDFCCLLT